jgi:hypothetical protein
MNTVERRLEPPVFMDSGLRRNDGASEIAGRTLRL